ncbi:alkaline phosphatase family protein [Aeoliella mucimassa]|uniref:Type I phosphodiesterase / nucleotide pyrophosphatase n=1 Tax=Aeoliella mucimassa TaxID=2527972 RepID=A0A518AW85_9BACT|nr:alkaline phosphatase family protein [Aeoliella mucimassa]QDU58951.1 Type I phosphodiesterase / nucleotide pyrophosphatase [Aeoliella mucimassa]
MCESQTRLLWVSWELADWQLLHPLIDAGEMPTLEKLIDTGGSGTLYAPPPPVNAAICTTMATGKRPWQHRICLSHQATVPNVKPVEAKYRAAGTLWEILSDQGLPTIAVGWPATHGSITTSRVVSDRYAFPTGPPGHAWPPAERGTYHPSELAKQFDPLRVQPEQIDAATLEQFVPDWQQVDQTRDPRLSRLCISLATDASYHAAATKLIASVSWKLAAVRLPGIGELCRMFVRHHLLADTPAAKPEPLYRQVVPAAFRMLDAMLARLMELVGPDTAVVLTSPSGVSGAMLGQPDSWKQSGGVFVAAGPGFTTDQLVHGINALDVVPTLLSWFGLPTAGDMEGRIRSECLITANTNTPRDSYEVDTAASDECTAEQRTAELRSTLSTADAWNYDWYRAQSLLDADRQQQALPLLESLFREFPEHALFSQTLFQTQLSLGLVAEAEETLEVLLDAVPPSMAPLLRAELAYAAGDRQLARQQVDLLLQHPPESSLVWYRVGLLLMALREWTKLESCARAVLAQSEDEEIAWLGLAEATLRRGDAQTAEQAAQRAISLQFYLPDAHLALARALVAQGRILAATQALDRLLQIDPHNHRAQAYRRRIGGALVE